ncbi:MAG TPA: LysM peptidoglycan-binding domain-containing protein [Thermoleophilaceae bacterium]
MHRFRTAVLAAALTAGACLSPAAAGARVAHTVGPGETLWSIAAASNLTTRALAAANGLPETANVVLGSTIWVPSEGEAAAALAQTGAVPSQGASTPGAGAPAPMGAYTVQPGDSLSAIAARSGVTAGQVAYMNGLDPSRPLLAGTVLKLPTPGRGTAVQPAQASAPAAAPASSPVVRPRVVPSAAPVAAPGRVTSGQIAQIATAHGVPASLASAIGWQESGFENGFVSGSNARGVMQILPGTWDWIQRNLASQALDPSSPTENVHAGVMYLGSLLRSTGGDPRLAAAAYYQGLGSVRQRGLLPETERYVDNVMALRGRFGGP